MRRINLAASPGRCAVALAALAAMLAGSAIAQAAPPRSLNEATFPDRPPRVRAPLDAGSMPCGIDPSPDSPGEGSSYPSAFGTLRAAVLFVDFSDAPRNAGTSLQAEYDRLLPGTQSSVQRLSYGQLTLDATPHLRWVRAPRSLREYGFLPDQETSYESYDQYVEDVMHAADPAFDFSGYQVVYIFANAGANAPGAYNQYADPTVDGNTITNSVTLNAFSEDTTSPVVVHETGHVLGLPDLYDLSARRYDRFVGPWDVMSNAFMNAPLLAWTRRTVGWLDDRNFRCVKRRATVNLRPVATAGGGIKGAVVRTTRKRGYVIEARTDSVGEGCADSGVLIYRVDTAVETGSGPVRVLPAYRGANDQCGSLYGALFEPKSTRLRSTYKDRNVKVSVLRRAGKGYRVRVIKR